MSSEPFGQVLRRDRERKEMSQEVLAKHLGVSQQAVANWESGQAMPSQGRRQRLLDLLGPDSELSRWTPVYEFVPAKGSVLFTTELKPDVAHRTMQQWQVDKVRKAIRNVLAHDPEAAKGFQVTLRQRGELHEELRAALPEEKRGYVGLTHKFGASHERAYDYISEGVIARITHLPAPSFGFGSQRMMAPILRLAMVADHSSDPHAPKPVLFVLTDVGRVTFETKMEPVIFDASVLGVAVVSVQSVAEIVSTIEELEALQRTSIEEWEDFMRQIDEYDPEQLSTQPPGDKPKTVDDDPI